MSSNQPDCLTSLVSYVPELNFGFNLPSTTAVNQFGISATNQKRQTVPLHPEPLTSLEIVSARGNCNCKCIPQTRTSPQPLRPALKKASLTKPWNKTEESFKNTEKGCEENRILIPKRPLETEAKAEKPQPLPARLLQKKKTVAFGRTVNVSQTIEGTSKAYRKFLDDSNYQKSFPKMVTDVQGKRFSDEFQELKEKVHKMQLKVDELTAKDSERNSQILKLTETMKKMLGGLAQFNMSNTSNEDSKKREKKVETEMHCHGKENIAPNKICVTERMTEDDEGNPVAHGKLFAGSKKKNIDEPSKEDLKWKIMKRKYAENEEFKRLVDEAIMKCGGDESLDIFASQQNKGDTGRVPSRRHEKKAQPISPVIRSTTRVTKQMTVEQIQHCENSPASCAFSYDSKKYLARHGIIPALSDDDEVEYNIACGKRLDPCMQSYYYPGNSVTYYSKNIKCNNMLSKDNSHSDYREEKHHHKEKGTPRVFDELNYQMDQFDTDDDEDVNNIIEISDEVEDHCGTGGKMRSSRDKRDWRNPARNDFRHQKDDGMRQYAKQRLNKSAWD
ncbi:unnamed protein product [Cercopithifilaria johnstoni]|uniref:Uncharacterized protein n=1 Tax=Cercopithifilaria johnstoni TaxID=2874296 RepID=A0A8J2M7K2_9BILA|nr:unnamed protein product [Cercopithifilaria johnstoni]